MCALLLIVAEAESADFFRLIDIGERVGIDVFYDLFEQGGLLFLHDADQDFSGGVCIDAFRVDYRAAAVQDLHDCVADFFRLIGDDIEHDAGLRTRRDDVRNLACQKQGDERVKYRGSDFDECRVRVHAFCRQQTDDTRQQNDDAVKQENKPACIKFGLFLVCDFPKYIRAARAAVRKKGAAKRNARNDAARDCLNNRQAAFHARALKYGQFKCGKQCHKARISDGYDGRIDCKLFVEREKRRDNKRQIQHENRDGGVEHAFRKFMVVQIDDVVHDTCDTAYAARGKCVRDNKDVRRYRAKQCEE